MIVIENTLIDEEILDEFFCCNLAKCFGSCCIEGDAGAPLEEGEIAMIEDYLDEIKKYMTDLGIETIDKSGVIDFDIFGNYVTPLINEVDCAFIFYEKGIAGCAIEKAYNEGKIPFNKPISCHLYPIRLAKKNNFTQLNYHRWFVCRDAREKGRNESIPLFEFLEQPLKRKFGEDWYRQLKQVYLKRLKK